MIEIAHRGYSDLYIDNSKESFINAVDNYFDMIELDIQLTKDERVIIYHDTFLKDKLIKNLNYKEIIEIDSTILTLEEFFGIIDVSKIKIYLDIKGTDIKISSILNDLIKCRPYLYNIFIASFNLIIINELYKLNPQLQLGFITDSLYTLDLFLKMIKESNLKFISFHWTMLDENIINFLHNNNIMVFSYTIKNKEILSFIDEFDIDGIITNGKLSDYRQGISKKKLNKSKNKIKKKEFILFFIIILLILFQLKNYFL